MSWVKDLNTPGIQNKSKPPETKAPANLWTKCLQCGAILYRVEIERNLHVCLRCDYHFPMPARKRMEMLLDRGSFKEFDVALVPSNPLGFEDLKPYDERVAASQKKSGEHEAAIWGEGQLDGQRLSIAAFVFEFMGGSMGSVVGEKITRCFEHAYEQKIPAIVVSSSGGARMQEGAHSLMQLAKTCAALERLKKNHLPYISILAHPTTGGVAASFAMLGDLNITEPGALVGFAGPRVIEQTIRQKLPEGFQRADFLLEHGMVDRIVHRKSQRQEIGRILKLLKHLTA